VDFVDASGVATAPPRGHPTPTLKFKVLPGEPQHAEALPCHAFKKKISGWCKSTFGSGKHFYKFELLLPQPVFLGRHRLELKQPDADARTLRRIARGSALSFFGASPRITGLGSTSGAGHRPSNLEIGRRGSAGSADPLGSHPTSQPTPRVDENGDLEEYEDAGSGGGGDEDDEEEGAGASAETDAMVARCSYFEVTSLADPELIRFL
jgi:hypothetical protein